MTWNRTFRTLSAQQGLSLVDNARFFAVLYMTATDALISVWDDKAHWSFWRPITAIREADTDGNPRTEPDSGLAAADPDAAVSGAPLGAHRLQRLDREDAPAVLRNGQDRLERHERGRHA